jgi:hypothetical protein
MTSNERTQLILSLAVRRMVRALRRLDPAFRRRLVNSINSETVREYYDQRLRLEGDADVTGVVDRYPFAPSDGSERIAAAFWPALLVLALAIVLQRLATGSSPHRVILQP